MKILKYLGIGLLVIVALVLLIALFVPKDVVYEKSILINAPIETVWENTNSLADMDKWNPWDEKDPTMSKGFMGTDGTIGAMQSWDSEVKEVGKGTQTITNIEAPTLFETDLVFLTPYESEAKAYVKLVQEGAQTNVTWGFKSVMPYPMNITSLFVNMESMMGEDWNKGLTKLKTICETEIPYNQTDTEE
ncbi:MAG: SRPBCC family protein [Bacteroidales bacterium]|nr:SRPBCC family protein [Bacteroidales bacterium]